MMQNLTRVCMDATLRMFSTRTNYWAEFGVDMTLSAVLIYEGLRLHTGGLLTVLLAIGLGLFVFTFIEYCFHRWLFHMRVPLFEQGHRMHHEHPRGYDSLPFFLPATVVLGLTGLGVLIMPTGFVFLMTGAMTFGYVSYGLSHHIIHHARFRQPLLMRWAAAHHIHHHHSDCNFGVTTPLWDILLRTRYARRHPGRA